MSKKRQKHSDQFKARVALEAIKENNTLSELSSRFRVHPTAISRWKKMLLEGAFEVFSRGRGNSPTEEELTAPLYEQIGRLQMEVDWFKKKL